MSHELCGFEFAFLILIQYFRFGYIDILHLNQHRLKAVEDLNKTNSEKQLLVDKIEQLELEKQQASVAKPPGI